jgi:hypothetical protein
LLLAKIPNVMPETVLNFRHLLIVLISEKRTLLKILEGQEKYDGLLKEINKYDIEAHDPWPKQKDLLKTLGLRRTELIDIMREMYEEFYSTISSDCNYPMQKTEILICASNWQEDFWVLSPEKLEFLPTVGDWFTIPFFRNNLSGGGHFKVKEINHEIENQKHIITIIIDDDITTQ